MVRDIINTARFVYDLLSAERHGRPIRIAFHFEDMHACTCSIDAYIELYK